MFDQPCFGCGKRPAPVTVSDPIIDLGYQLCPDCIRKCYPSHEERLRQLEESISRAGPSRGR